MVNQTKTPIETALLNTLLHIIAKRLGKPITIDGVETTDGSHAGGDHQQVPHSILRMVMRPHLNPQLLALIAKMVNNDPDAKLQLIAMLKSPSTSLSNIKALVSILALSASHGVVNARDVLVEGLHAAPASLRQVMTHTIRQACPRAEQSRAILQSELQLQESPAANRYNSPTPFRMAPTPVA